jgi:hypothetical protein
MFLCVCFLGFFGWVFYCQPCLKAHLRLARCLLELGRTAESERWLRLFRDRFPEQARCQACLRLDKDIRAAADKEKEKEDARPGSQGQVASASSNSDNSSGGSSGSSNSSSGLNRGPDYFRRYGGGEDAGQPEEVEPEAGEDLEAEEDLSRPFVSEHGLRISSQV